MSLELNTDHTRFFALLRSTCATMSTQHGPLARVGRLTLADNFSGISPWPLTVSSYLDADVPLQCGERQTSAIFRTFTPNKVVRGKGVVGYVLNGPIASTL